MLVSPKWRIFVARIVACVLRAGVRSTLAYGCLAQVYVRVVHSRPEAMMAASFSLARHGCDSQHRGPTSARIRVGLPGGLESKKKKKKKKKKSILQGYNTPKDMRCSRFFSHSSMIRHP